MKKQTFNNFTAKMALLLFLISSVPLIVGGIIMLKSSIKNAEENELNLYERQLNLSVVETQQKIIDVDKFYNSIFANKTLNHYFTKDFYDDIEIITRYNRDIAPTISWLSSLKPSSIKSFNILTQNTAVFETTNIKYIDDEHLNNASLIQYKHFHDNTNSLFIMYPLNARVGEKNSYIEIELDYNYIIKSLITFSELNNIYLQACTPNDLPLYNNFPEDAEIPSLSSQNFTKHGQNYYSHQNINNLLDVNLVFSSKNLEKNSKNLIQVFYTILFICIIFFILVFITYFNLSLRRLKKIIFAVERIQNADFDIYIDHSNRDVVDHLAKSINTMSEKINKLINEVYIAELKEKKMLVATLQKQINPHFLYNTLECIKMKAEINDQEEISNNITSLGSILRYNISIGKEYNSLTQELEHLNNYIAIQNLINNNTIKFFVQNNIHNDDVLLPKFCIQPIVENSILHGLSDTSTQLINIFLTVENDNDSLYITICDDGIGIDPNIIEYFNRQFINYQSTLTLEKEHGIALFNINTRLKLLFGDKYGLTAQSNSPHGFKIQLKFPLDFTNK